MNNACAAVANKSLTYSFPNHASPIKQARSFPICGEVQIILSCKTSMFNAVFENIVTNISSIVKNNLVYMMEYTDYDIHVFIVKNHQKSRSW